MGRSSPSFFVQDCAYSTYYHTVEADGYGNGRDFDADDEASIRAYARLIEARNSGCWKHEGFSVSADEDDDDESSTRYHFLEYSGMCTSYQHDTTNCRLLWLWARLTRITVNKGTRQLAEDIERVRILFGGHKISGEHKRTMVASTPFVWTVWLCLWNLVCCTFTNNLLPPSTLSVYANWQPLLGIILWYLSLWLFIRNCSYGHIRYRIPPKCQSHGSW